MSTPLKFLILALLPQLPLLGQEAEVVDPTSESPAITKQLDAIRGVEELESLKKQFQALTVQNQQLLEKLGAIQGEMDALRQGQADAARRRSALPELRLVAQIRTNAIMSADISVGEKTYRVVDGRPFRLALSNNEMIEATASFREDETVEITIPDINTTQLLAFKPSTPPPPKKQVSRLRSDDD